MCQPTKPLKPPAGQQARARSPSAGARACSPELRLGPLEPLQPPSPGGGGGVAVLEEAAACCPTALERGLGLRRAAHRKAELVVQTHITSSAHAIETSGRMHLN